MMNLLQRLFGNKQPGSYYVGYPEPATDREEPRTADKEPNDQLYWMIHRASHTICRKLVKFNRDGLYIQFDLQKQGMGSLESFSLMLTSTDPREQFQEVFDSCIRDLIDVPQEDILWHGVDHYVNKVLADKGFQFFLTLQRLQNNGCRWDDIHLIAEFQGRFTEDLNVEKSLHREGSISFVLMYGNWLETVIEGYTTAQLRSALVLNAALFADEYCRQFGYRSLFHKAQWM